LRGQGEKVKLSTYARAYLLKMRAEISKKPTTGLKESKNVQLVGNFLSNLIETDSHEANVRTTKLVCRLLQRHTRQMINSSDIF